MSLVWDLRLYVAAQTIDRRNGANEVYTAEAQANWQFNGSGQIDADKKWTPFIGPDGKRTSGFVTPPTAWGEVKDEPVTTGDRFNDVLGTATWDRV
jgi:hypothetical protein